MGLSTKEFRLHENVGYVNTTIVECEGANKL